MVQEALQLLDEAIAAASPSFHKKLNAGATEAELGALSAEAGALPDDVLAWFRWRAGSSDGFLSGTSWGLVTIEEAIDEIRFARSASGSPELAAHSFVPLLTGRDGGLMYYVDVNGSAFIWEYDRGTRVKTTPFAAWLSSLVERWRAESAVLRVAWVRWQRSPIGGEELHLPARSRAKLRTLLAGSSFKIEDCVRLDGSSAARISIGPVPGWRRSDAGGGAQCDIVLTREGATQLAAALADKKKETFRVPQLDELRLAFLDR